jgi:hypothetical protein
MNLNDPHGVAVDGQGDVFIADAGSNRALEVTGGTPTPIGSGLNLPAGLAVDSTGDVFIADSGNQRVVEEIAGVLVTVGTAAPTLSVSGGGTYTGNPSGAQGIRGCGWSQRCFVR